MTEHFKTITRSQFAASLRMLSDCVERCPSEHWNNPANVIAKYPFWMVAYHTLCFVDLYLSPGEAVWKPRSEQGGLHPAGWDELNEEYPSREFSQAELLGYGELCRGLLDEAIAAETAETLQGPSGFARLTFSRAELYLYNLRHVQHHTGQLSAFLRRAGVELPRWVRAG